MLGKGEYLKFVLKSICEERIRIFLSDKVIQNEDSINVLKNSSDITAFLNEQGWYKDFINDLPPDFKPLYRFAAFTSNNIGTLKKDKFNINKVDSTALDQANEFKNKSKLKDSENVYGEWHLQDIFINEVKKLKGAL